jgi:hypothetical protein
MYSPDAKVTDAPSSLSRTKLGAFLVGTTAADFFSSAVPNTQCITAYRNKNALFTTGTPEFEANLARALNIHKRIRLKVSLGWKLLLLYYEGDISADLAVIWARTCVYSIVYGSSSSLFTNAARCSKASRLPIREIIRARKNCTQLETS